MDTKQISDINPDSCQEMEDIIRRSFSKSLSDNELSILREWLEESGEHREYYTHIKSIWSACRVMNAADSEDISKKQATMMARLNARIDAEENMGKSPEKKSRHIFAYSLALCTTAAALVFGVFTWLGVRGGSSSNVFRQEYTTYYNTQHDIKAVMLPDSSKVWMKPGTFLQYADEGEERIVQMTGEAYFDVHKSTDNPFTIKTRNLSVKVLGTAFSIKSEENSSTTSVVLERGSVRLYSPEGTGLVRLTPDQKAVYDASTMDMHIEVVNAAPHIIHNYNKIALTGVSVDEIVQHIQKMYNIRLKGIPDSNSDTKYTLNYKRTDTALEVVHIVNVLTGLKLEIINQQTTDS